MERTAIINTVGIDYHTPNIEGGEYSYVQEAGSKANLEKAVGRTLNHFKLDIRFEKDGVVLLIETKQRFLKKDEIQLNEYLMAERALHYGKKIICMLANTNDNKIKVWKSFVDDDHILKEETVLDSMEHYVKLFDTNRQNDREKVMKNTYALNEFLHKIDINENLRSQFVGTTLLYIKDMVNKIGSTKIDDELVSKLNEIWSLMDEKQIRAGIESTLNNLLDGSENKIKKVELLQKNVLNDQKVKKLTRKNWIDILDTILLDIYRYIDADSSEGQDILNLFFIAFNKYTGKADKNQAFTPDHITEFMCRLTDVDSTKVVLDATCGSGSFLVQAMVKELADCRRNRNESDAKNLMKVVKEQHIFGIEVEEKAYGLSTTNMLIHGDGNSNIKFGSCFDCKQFIKDANPDIILMNPPYNAKPKDIPDRYKKNWTTNAKNGKEDASKGMVFIHYLSDVIKEMNEVREKNNEPHKTVKLAVLLPVSAAIGTSGAISKEKKAMLENNTLEAVFTLPNEIFYPGASACACCMLFTLGQPHLKADGTARTTFFGYCKDDGFKKKKNLGRVEQFAPDGTSIWKNIEKEWLSLYESKIAKDGKSAVTVVNGNDEWLCEAYMKTDYSKLCGEDFQQTLNNYLSHQIKEGKIYES
ncbi:MAG: SAM-dependent methyltransferase [Blautia sp.]|nr:SAM-dependent methyltransferase [Blautia sp.]MCM1199975.1 SAM-dependent methyltransferase [Bacteroides fragilis]